MCAPDDNPPNQTIKANRGTTIENVMRAVIHLPARAWVIGIVLLAATFFAATLFAAIELKPALAVAYYTRGNVYFTKGDYDRAIADFSQAIQLQPGSVEAYYNRGLAYDSKGDHDRAIADFSQAIQLKPNFTDAYYGRGLAYEAQGRNSDAINDFERVLELTTDQGLRQKAEDELLKLKGK